MTFEISCKNYGAYVLFSASGPITKESLVELGKRIHDECTKARVTGAVVDCTAIEGALSVTELYYSTPAFVRTVGIAIKVAYINPPSQWNLAVDRFSRDVATNHGGSLELFESEAEAANWLLKS